MFDDDPEDSPEKKAAYDKLCVAIEEYFRAHDDPGLVLDWVMVTHLTDPRADGTDEHRTAFIGSDRQPGYRSLGLLEYGSAVVKAQIANQVF